MVKVKRRIWIAFLLLTVGLLTVAASCPEVKDCKTAGCPEGRECRELYPGVNVCVASGTEPTPPPPTTTLPGARDCRTLGCPTHGAVCIQVARDVWSCGMPIPPTPTPTPSPSPHPTATPTPEPTATPTPEPTATPTPAPSPTPCAPSAQKVCVGPDGEFVEFFDPRAGGGAGNCYTCKSWLGMMIAGHYFDAGDPKEDGDVGGHPGYWLNYDSRGVLVGLIGKRDCKDPNGRLMIANFPRVEERVVPCATPTPGPTATLTPGPTPTPGPGGCPGLLKVGGMFLSAVDCGNCRKQGYLGVRVNVTSTELCREGDPGCVCDPLRNRCEMPRECQNPLGATVYLTLPGHFTNDLCDSNSDNAFNCHHKPKANEAGVTTFTHCPHNARPDDPRCTSKCIDVREVGTREVACR